MSLAAILRYARNRTLKAFPTTNENELQGGLDVNDEANNNDSLIISYLTLRKIVGYLGTSFPFVLAVGAAVLFSSGMQTSVSSYYHTGMQDVFVGTLCVIGFFLLSYRGYERADDIAGDLACLFAVGVAFFPASPDTIVANSERVIGYVHLAFAALFFLTLIYFSLFLFTKTKPNVAPSGRKIQRNRIYKICGYTMGACILLIAVHALLPDGIKSSVKAYAPVFWLEGIAVVFFGISWLTKGEAILKDLPAD